MIDGISDRRIQTTYGECQRNLSSTSATPSCHQSRILRTCRTPLYFIELLLETAFVPEETR
jgi:hypothetical protein